MIKAVKYRELLDSPEWYGLEREYAAECALPEMGEPDPQRKLYAAMEASGGLQCFGVYASALVGFISLLTWTVPHYGKTIVSTESIFLSQRDREHGTGIKMIDFVVDFGREKKARMIQLTAPVGSRLGRLLTVSEHWRHSNDVFVRGI